MYRTYFGGIEVARRNPSLRNLIRLCGRWAFRSPRCSTTAAESEDNGDPGRLRLV